MPSDFKFNRHLVVVWLEFSVLKSRWESNERKLSGYSTKYGWSCGSFFSSHFYNIGWIKVTHFHSCQQQSWHWIQTQTGRGWRGTWSYSAWCFLQSPHHSPHHHWTTPTEINGTLLMHQYTTRGWWLFSDKNMGFCSMPMRTTWPLSRSTCWSRSSASSLSSSSSTGLALLVDLSWVEMLFLFDILHTQPGLYWGKRNWRTKSTIFTLIDERSVKELTRARLEKKRLGLR